jgi:hypothetical protein
MPPIRASVVLIPAYTNDSTAVPAGVYSTTPDTSQSPAVREIDVIDF